MIFAVRSKAEIGERDFQTPLTVQQAKAMRRSPSVDEMESVRRAVRRVHLGEAAVVERRGELESLLVQLRSEGVGVSELSRLTGLSRETVYEACRRAERPMSGRRMRQHVRGRGMV
jgi:hypothetical protein